MSKVIEIIKNLNNLISLKPATMDEVEDVEIDLALPLAEDYKAYLLTFGAIMADDVELTGIAKSENRSVVQVTKREWAINHQVSRKLYVIENAGIDGIIIWQDGSGAVYESRPNHGAAKIAESLSDYLESKQK
ncbi:SMI1/KNR4 family protein [Megasphaera sp.]|uniref:SMI1/KNR4 family protein n=1 Tax=Megasphaera TaxID=906 RepID=UPI001DCF3041|nr:SMI1/KNR4 family protein [Megasphaera sp.]MBS6789291.1 SMI1/KNR4 family protein [Megasphaera sp.]